MKTEDEAQSVLSRVKGGEKFEDLAEAVSDCPSKSQGGSLGWFGKAEMVGKIFGDEII